MATHLGILYGDGPGWFHTLTRQDQIDVIAYHRIRTQPAKTKAPRLRESVKVDGSARDFWLGE